MYVRESPYGFVFIYILDLLTMLQISSCFFGTIIVAAHVYQNEIIFYLFTLITIFSIMYHSNKNTLFQQHFPLFFRFISIVDRILAHLAYFYVTLEMWRHQSNFIILSLAILLLWLRSNATSNPRESNVLHLCLHLTSILAVHLFLCY